jgi:hypothetical protein
MTTADFLAALFGPLVIVFAVLLNTVRDPVLLQWIGLAACSPAWAMVCCGWHMAAPQ